MTRGLFTELRADPRHMFKHVPIRRGHPLRRSVAQVTLLLRW